MVDWANPSRAVHPLCQEPSNPLLCPVLGWFGVCGTGGCDGTDPCTFVGWMVETYNLRTLSRKNSYLSAIGMAMIMGGLLLGIVLGQLSSSSFLFWIAGAIMFGGLIPLLWSTIIDFRISKLRTEGPPENVNPSPTDDKDPISWKSNPYRLDLLRREHQYRLVAIPSVVWFGISFCLFILGDSGHLGDALWIILSVLTSLFVSAYVALFSVSSGFSPQSRFTPIRVGLSDSGIHAEYDLETLRGKPLPRTRPSYIPWKEVTSMSSGPAFRAATYVAIERAGGGKWYLGGLDPNIVANIQAAWDAGPNIPLS